MASGVNIFLFEMQLRLFRHFVPVSVVLLASSDALLITGAFYQLLSTSEISTPIFLRASTFAAQFSAGLAIAAVTGSPLIVRSVTAVQSDLHDMLNAIPVLEVNIAHSSLRCQPLGDVIRDKANVVQCTLRMTQVPCRITCSMF